MSHSPRNQARYLITASGIRAIGTSRHAAKDAANQEHRLQQEKMDKMLAEPPENYFDVKHVKVDIPEKARLFGSVKCSKCGEMTAESRVRVEDGKFVCYACSEEYTRRL